MSPLPLLVLCAASIGLAAAPAAAETTHIEIRAVVAAPDGQPVVDRARLVA
jgi:TRAP-type C4-dicarboxylate transport system substrate-binding protein